MGLMITVFAILFSSAWFQPIQEIAEDCGQHLNCSDTELCAFSTCLAITEIECCNQRSSCNDREVCITSEKIQRTPGKRNCTGNGRCIGCKGQIEQLIFLVHAANGRRAIDDDLSGKLEYHDAINLKSVTKWTAEKLLHWNKNDSYCMYEYKWIQCSCLEDISSCGVSAHDAEGKLLGTYTNDTGTEIRLNVRYTSPNGSYVVDDDNSTTESVHQLFCHRFTAVFIFIKYSQ